MPIVINEIETRVEAGAGPAFLTGRSDARLDPAPALLAGHRLEKVTGDEAMCRPMRFVIDLELPAGAITSPDDLSGLLQQPLTLVFSDPSGEIHREGLIIEVELTGQRARGEVMMRLVMQDPLALAGYSRRTRAFTGKSVADIAKIILDAHHLSATIADGSGTAARVVQWAETDLDFLGRLLAEDGCFYYIRPGAAAGAQQVIAGGTAGSYGAVADAVEAMFVGAGDLARDHGVFSFAPREGLVPGKVEITEHISSTPRTPTTSSVSPAGPGSTRTAETDQDHQHRFPPGTATARHANRAAEALTANRRRWHGSSSFPGIHPGRCVSVSNLSLPGAPERYLALTVQHHWQAAGDGDGQEARRNGGGRYRNSFIAIEFDKIWRPWPPPKAPLASGARLGVVVDNNVASGEASPEGSSLDQGVYEVAFPSEPDTDGKPLIQRARLAEPAAGNGRGLHVPPEVGDEVVVIHQHGDIDRPVIAGVLYHGGLAGPKVQVSDGTTISSVFKSRTGHQLRYVDQKGSEALILMSGTQDHSLIFDDAGKKITLDTKGDLIETIAGKHVTSVGKDQITAVTGNAATKVSGNLALVVEKNAEARIQGDQLTVVTGNQLIAVKTDLKFQVSGNADGKVVHNLHLVVGEFANLDAKHLGVTASGRITIDATAEGRFKARDMGIFATTLIVQAKTVSVQAEDELTLTCGSASITLKKSGDITISGGKVEVKGSSEVAVTGPKIGLN